MSDHPSAGQVMERQIELLVLDLDGDGRLADELRRALGELGTTTVVALDWWPGRGAAGDPTAVLRRALSELPGAELVVAASPGRHEEARDLVRQVRQEAPQRPLLVAAAADSSDDLLDFLHLGAADVLVPPFGRIEIEARLRRHREIREAGRQLDYRLRQKLGLRHIVGESPTFLAALDRIPLMARCDATVLILGETGTGKDVCARAIHYLSSRSARPFIPVNCGAIPSELVENELFGHERSAYTGAGAAYPGLIREAEGGTLFLDEIDCLPVNAQVKLLRFLQNKEYRSLGSTRTLTADVRVIAAANGDVEAALAEGRLRRDLFYRLNVLPLELPPLRRRSQDVPLLAAHFATRYALEQGRGVPTLSAEALQALLLHDWPGNVRELQHVIERAILLAGDRPSIELDDIQLASNRPPEPEAFQEAKARAVAAFERNYIESLLTAHRGNITRAAEAARKNRRAFWELIRKHRIDVERFRAGGPSR